MVKLQVFPLQLYRKKWTLLQVSFIWLLYILGAPASKLTSTKKATVLKFNVCYVSQGILLFIFSGYRLYAWLTVGRSLIKTKLTRLINSVCFSSGINYKESKTWKVQCEYTQWKVQCMVQENNIENTVQVCWYQNKLS